MKMFFKTFMTLSLLVFASSLSQAQTTAKLECSKLASTSEKCKPVNCNPALCDAMVAAGLCSKEEAALCKAKNTGTKVASAKLEREETQEIKLVSAEISSPENLPKKAAGSKTCAKKNSKNSSKSMK